MIWRIRARSLELTQSLLMGILNVTPDSFSDGGQFMDADKAVDHALEMIDAGADIIDLGGESSRPGASPLTAEEEENRILPILSKLRKQTKVPLSIDTTKSQIAVKCLEAGADIINDVSGLRDSGLSMVEAVKQYNAGLVIMHRRGNARTMQNLTEYKQVTQDVLAELRMSVDFASQAGLALDQIVVDPGLGFAKTADQNFQLLKEVERFHDLGRPVMLGPSRKSFIGEVTKQPTEFRDYATAAVVAIGVMKGIQIFRVHQVRAIKDVISISEAMRGEGYVRSFEMGVH